MHLQNAAVSREHAIVERRHGAWYVTDSGSRHGTLVNTIAIDSDDPTRLYHEDLLGVGPWTFQVQCDGSGDTGAVAPEPEPAEPETPSAARFAAAPTDLYPTRATLLLRLGDSDEQVRELSWREFEERYRPVIVGYARKRGATDSEAEDILQDVLVGFFRVSDAFEYDPSKGKFRSYLGTAVKHAYVVRRSRKKLAFGEVDLAAEREPGTEQTWAWQWTRGVLERAL
ncbi:MAG: FHA domain-containing protein, partial [Planctomycetes bacterium]|nr:FHA domain-containing protein [Planctomycetota bacterium]